MSTGGMPLLSGPPPEYTTASGNEQSCRKCDKEFNILFTRSRRCHHCGYLYCHSCSDFQALMPRGGSETGYDAVPVCTFCVDNLTITAGGRSKLRSLPLARLKKYANAYSIKFNGVLEKDDLIDTLIAARDRNGCLRRTNEDFYRKNSVPDRRSSRPRGFFTRAMDAMDPDRSRTASQAPPQQPPPYQPRQRTTSGPSAFPRPDLDPRRRQQQQQQQQQHQYPPRRPPFRNASPTPPSSSDRSHLNVPSSYPGAQQSRGRTRAASASSPSQTPRVRSPSPVVPTLDELLEMREADVARLGVGVLKSVLFRNHVNARLVVEKAELVEKALALVEDERRERARRVAAEEAERMAEEAARLEGEQETRTSAEAETEVEAEAEDRMDVETDDLHELGEREETRSSAHEDNEDEAAPPPPPPKPAPPSTPPTRGMSPKAQAKASHLERTGLCVICQDEEANIAIVDCGHMCLCRPCSDLIMKSSRECPLCRTRIVTEQRLLRIFKS